MPARLKLTALATLGAVAAACAAIAAPAEASIASQPVIATPTQVADQLFVAGDVGRLADVPSGTESLVLEKVLQQLYTDDPSLPASDAVGDIRGLQGALASGGAQTSAATLTVMSGNERILAILQALEAAGPPTPVALAVTEVAQRALADSSYVSSASGQYFNAAADTLSSLSLGSFSPATVLEATVALGAANPMFAGARDQLWSADSHESIGDDTAKLVSENPALSSNPYIAALVAKLSGGSFSSDIGTVLGDINGAQKVVSDQTCTPGGPPAGPGSGQPDCSSGALHDAELIAKQCPNGINGCAFDTSPYSGDPQREETAIAQETALETAEAGLLGYANTQLQTAEQASALASSQISDEENQYLNAQSLNAGLKAGEDVVGLVATLSVSEIDPVAAIGALFGVVNDAVGYSVNAPDPNQIIISGLQNISQQISDFEQYTQSAFAAINAQLGSISSQIAQQTYQLSTQLTDAQNQITTLGSSLSKLQSSVDQLQAEIQSLFVAGANNDLGSLTATWLGYPQLNGTEIPSGSFGTPAGLLYQDATGTAVSQTVLSAPGAFDAGSAETQLAGGPLDTNIDYLNLFPADVADAPNGALLAGPLQPGCASRGSGELCLPNPDFWASSTRAFAQLLLENPDDVMPARVSQLNAMIGDGSLLDGALSKISANDAGADPKGTGSKLLDGLLSYYSYWGAGNHPAGAPPSLQQALENETQAYLASQPVSSQNLNEQGVDPWGGIGQFPDYANLLQSKEFTNIPLCNPSDPPPGGVSSVLPRLNSRLVNAIPYDLLNAIRLGIGNFTTCWIAGFDNGSPGGGNQGDLTMDLVFQATTPDPNNPNQSLPYEIGYETATQYVTDLDLAGGDGTDDAELTVLHGWQAPTDGPDFSTLLQNQSDASIQEGQGLVETYVDPLLTARLSAIQQGVYNDILSNGSTLTSGTSQGTDVAAAAQRFAGADALLTDYLRLGFPQALASDDSLQNLVNGAASDVFAYPGANTLGDTTLAGVDNQLVQYYEAARAKPAYVDPASSPVGVGTFVSAIADRRNALTQQLGAYVRNGRADGQSGADGGSLAEESPLVSSTLNRLHLSADVLADTLDGTLDRPPAGTTTTTSTTSTATASTVTMTPPSTTVRVEPTVTTMMMTSTVTASGRGGVEGSTTVVSAAKTTRGDAIAIGVGCAQAPCEDEAVATVTETVSGRRIIAISSRHHGRRSRARRRTVVVGWVGAMLAPGEHRTLTVRLNRVGRALLKRHGSLRVTVTVEQLENGGMRRTIAKRVVTLHEPPVRRHGPRQRRRRH